MENKYNLRKTTKLPFRRKLIRNSRLSRRTEDLEKLKNIELIR
jgi:hypothetical protein